MSDNLPKRFINLHGHSNKSVFDGFGSGDEHLQFAADNGMDAMAITDHGNVNAYPECVQKADDLTKKGRPMKFLPGCEFYYVPSLADWRVAKEDRDKRRKEEKEASKRAPPSDEDDPGVSVEDEDASKRDRFVDPVNRRHHLVVLPKSRRGLENLFRLVSRSSREGYYRFPRIDAAMLKEHGEDLVISTACVAGLPSFSTFSQFPGKTFDELTADLLDDPAKMEAVQGAIGGEIDRIVDAVGVGNVYLELQFNRLAPQHLANRAILEFASRQGMPLVATADSHYCSPDLWRAREVYKLLGRANRGQGRDIGPESIPSDVKQLKCELYPKNAEQMWASYREYCAGFSFYDDDLVRDAVETSWHIAHDVVGNVDPDRSVKLPSFGTMPGMTPFQTLLELCKEGMRRRGLSRRRAYVERLKTELNVIRQLDNASYFLTIRAMVECVRKEVLFGVGRGSGVGCLVNYVIGITDVDPVEHKLIFARFMSLARAKNDLPDLDLDFADRDQAVKILKREFGEHCVVPITNFNAMQIKSLVKDVAKLHGVPFEESNEATRNLDFEVKPHLHTGDETKGAVELTYEACVEHSTAFRDFIERHPEVANDVQILGKQPKALGKHAGGIVVLDDPGSVMPLICVRGEIQTPWSEGQNVKGLSPYGICKVDFLALKTLRMIQQCIAKLLKRTEGGVVSLELENGKKITLRGTELVRTTNRGCVEARDIDDDDDIDERWVLDQLSAV